MTITEFMNHPWIMVSFAGWGDLGARTVAQYGRLSLDPISLSSAIYEGPSDSIAHQPCPEGGQGAMGGCQGEEPLRKKAGEAFTASPPAGVLT